MAVRAETSSGLTAVSSIQVVVSEEARPSAAEAVTRSEVALVGSGQYQILTALACSSLTI